MGEILSGRQMTANSITQESSISRASSIAIVYDVILDENHPKIKDGKATMADIGSVVYRLYDDTSTPYTDLTWAKPYESNIKDLPTINEKIEIINTGLGRFYKRINQSQNTNASAAINEISFLFENSNATNSTNAASVEDFRKSTKTNISKTNTDTSKKWDKLGNYFQFTPNIHRLKLYEGDSVFESRFGQSLRFSAYNNPKNTYSPTLILRNSESEISKKLPLDITIDENVNLDGSIIAMTSNQYQLPFIPGVVDDKGSSNFETKPDSFSDYPTKLIGHQLLINSGRIILSAKSAEMIFYSKKNYGFISDGAMSIDNKLGIDISVGGNINILTNDRDVAFHTGNGGIFLGDTDREPLVMGNKLVDLLADLIVAILNQQYLTPSGPTALGPQNFNDFIELNDRLNELLSKRNQTS
jgi:hypothetical protein